LCRVGGGGDSQNTKLQKERGGINELFGGKKEKKLGEKGERN